MAEMEEKLQSVLNNPQLMQQIMSMAQSLGQSQNVKQEQEPQNPGIPDFDPALPQTLSGLAGQGTIDRDQQALLKALHPYLPRNRVQKLEKAMRAAKMARMASAFLNAGGVSILTGR